MSQFDFGNLESPLSGSNFINSNLEPWRDALHTLHKGPSTPSYAVAGMMWINDSGSPWILNIFDGTDNISVGTVDPTTNVFTPSGVSQAAADITVNNSGFNVFTGDDVQEVLGEADAFADSVGTAAFENVPTVREIPQNSQSGAYTLVLSDAGKHIFHPAADTTNRTFTIPANASVAFPIGTAITFVNEAGTGGVVTIAITSDTLVLAGPGTTGSRTLARNGMATALKVTATKWMINGAGLT